MMYKEPPMEKVGDADAVNQAFWNQLGRVRFNVVSVRVQSSSHAQIGHLLEFSSLPPVPGHLTCFELSSLRIPERSTTPKVVTGKDWAPAFIF